jgi:hypothetical protein
MQWLMNRWTSLLQCQISSNLNLLCNVARLFYYSCRFKSLHSTLQSLLFSYVTFYGLRTCPYSLSSSFRLQELSSHAAGTSYHESSPCDVIFTILCLHTLYSYRNERSLFRITPERCTVFSGRSILQTPSYISVKFLIVPYFIHYSAVFTRSRA